MLIDTHCHLDATEFDLDRTNVISNAVKQSVGKMIVPAVELANFQSVIDLSNSFPQIHFALGIHPLYVDVAQPSDFILLKQLINEQLNDPKSKLVAVGEIGLDFFVTHANRETQEYFLSEQLKIAQEFNLPVILHVRRAVDDVLKHLRHYALKGGIAHAFNGSMQQAQIFINLGFKLGFGGAMTYSRALKIRDLAKNLPLDSIVLETDSPDISPEWIGTKARNEPAHLLKIAQVLADIRGVEIAQIIEVTGNNANHILPKLSALCTPVNVLHEQK